MKRIIEKIILIFIFISVLYITKVYAAGTFSISPSKSSINKGESVTITIKADNAYGEVAIKATNATVSPASVFLQNDTKTVTVTSTSDEDIKVTVAPGSGGLGDIEENPINDTKSITIKINKQTPPNPDNGGNNGGNNGGTTTPEPPKEKSKEARLSNFGIKPNDFSGFKRDKTEYSTEVPNNVKEVEVYATPADSKAKVSGAGKVSLKEGNNEIKVTVTAEAGNTKTYTLTIKRRTAAEDEASATTAESSNADLKTLGINPKDYDFEGFKKDKTEYSTEVPNEIDEIEVYAEAENSKAQINGIGKISLKEGKNTINVEVIAEDGTKKTYVIEVTREESDEVEGTNSDKKFGLSSLKIKDLELSPNFEIDIYDYKVELNADLASLEISAISADKDATIEIIGNENLQQGENTITILVRNDKTDETATYQITVNKNVVVEEEMNWLKPSTWGKEEIIKIIIISALIILIIIAIILKIKISKENKKNKDVDLPGGDELDKALTEHQEIAELDNQDEIENFEQVESTEEPEIKASLDEFLAGEYYEKDEQLKKFENNESRNGRKRGKHF